MRVRRTDESGRSLSAIIWLVVYIPSYDLVEIGGLDMKKFALLAVVVVAVVCSLGATLQQATISPVLTTLKFEHVPPPDKKVGGPMEFKVTKETLDYLRELREGQKTIVIESDGKVGIKGPDGKVEMIETHEDKVETK